jgi:hypothetical protein
MSDRCDLRMDEGDSRGFRVREIKVIGQGLQTVERT